MQRWHSRKPKKNEKKRKTCPTIRQTKLTERRDPQKKLASGNHRRRPTVRRAEWDPPFVPLPGMFPPTSIYPNPSCPPCSRYSSVGPSRSRHRDGPYDHLTPPVLHSQVERSPFKRVASGSSPDIGIVLDTTFNCPPRSFTAKHTPFIKSLRSVIRIHPPYGDHPARVGLCVGVAQWSFRA